MGLGERMGHGQAQVLSPLKPPTCAESFGPEAPRLGTVDLRKRLNQVRTKAAYEACIEQERKDRAYKIKRERESLRQYGSVRISWTS
jgi:hypothetical protein